MTRLDYPSARDGHYYLPITIYGSKRGFVRGLGLMDTGASKCQIPTEENDNSLKLQILRQESVNTAGGAQFFGVVSLPRIVLTRVAVGVRGRSLSVEETDLKESNVEAWLGDMFILGMNFLSKFDIQLKRGGHIILSRNGKP